VAALSLHPSPLPRKNSLALFAFLEPRLAVVALSFFVLPGDEALGAMMSKLRDIQQRCSESPELKISKINRISICKKGTPDLEHGVIMNLKDIFDCLLATAFSYRTSVRLQRTQIACND
jgi:hypothetical protein